MDPSAIKGPGMTAAARGVDRASMRRLLRTSATPPQAVSPPAQVEATTPESHNAQVILPSRGEVADAAGLVLFEAAEQAAAAAQDGERSAALRIRAYANAADPARSAAAGTDVAV